MRTIRRDATQPAQRRLRAWRDCRAPVPSVFPSAASPDAKTEVMFKPGSGESTRPQAGSPRALETIGIHLKVALGLSNEVGPPHSPSRGWVPSSDGWPSCRPSRSGWMPSSKCLLSVCRRSRSCLPWLFMTSKPWTTE